MPFRVPAFVSPFDFTINVFCASGAISKYPSPVNSTSLELPVNAAGYFKELSVFSHTFDPSDNITEMALLPRGFVNVLNRAASFVPV